MKKMKRLIVMLMVVTMLGASLSGCSKKEDTATSGNSETGGLDTSKEVELVMYVISNEPAGQATVDENFNKILKEKLNCSLKINWIGWAEYANKYPLLFSSGESFDMAYCANWLNFSSLAKKGAFMNLDELWPKYAPDNYAKHSDTAKQQAVVDGSYYCVPTLLATYSAYGPIYRTDILEGTNWDGEMNTFEDMEEYLDLVAATGNGMEPLEIYSAGSELDDMWMYYNGQYAIKGSTNDFLFIDPAEENPKLYTYYEYDKVGEFLDIMNRWNEKGFFGKSALADTDSEKLRNGKAALRVHNVDTYQGYTIEHPEYKLKYSNLVKDVSNLSFTQDAMVISNTAKNPERALAFWNLLTTDQEVYDAFNYGILGESYEVNEEGQFKILDTDKYATTAMWAVRTTDLNRDQEGTPQEINAYKEEWDAYIQDGVGAQKYRSFVIDTSSIETEYASCLSVHQQYWWPLELGYTDKEKGLTEYKEKMEAAGIDKVRQVIQEQLDAYIADLSK
ncbi:putative aldouronate transport system substrate-binding protein [Anaerosporobacter mobilis DSM 15930]|jgi:putative aldouronate transport system substrate-binding protein|uniref:Putative aldouronate transport system substrate-binding protein n=1 Tax=Anaerosporobacter mobilis DSM 15930 TaxID=1120996 RepID=A0A1M7K9J3_9FIRM|nr:ABC transporter substrate-binding protein [Anaerosporobacter mobilis]SHM61950.1 putative aldouronate transport system substrate-binding protein [Anaerosporobacter mobilis DSM 15930]